MSFSPSLYPSDAKPATRTVSLMMRNKVMYYRTILLALGERDEFNASLHDTATLNLLAANSGMM
jgi:hypothetical protein